MRECSLIRTRRMEPGGCDSNGKLENQVINSAAICRAAIGAIAIEITYESRLAMK